ncbi:hypothetical protein JOF29_001333 [Kribbella aluminosa]|uniref:PH domain-containing protein n=1 Tax=Kribbella aluminosa TaxID=416017 RepID=A0ABS4UF60_9ACTN|nr:hypothetical protein [Kribbella aluminosa]MBP2350250.1 hypothetical protein [Kribbella aluminosa]
MGERLPEAWMVEWHRNGRVEFPLRRWSFIQYPIFLVLGYSVMAAVKLPDMLADDIWRFLGYLVILAYVGVAIVIIRQLVTQRPYVVVDRVGIHRGRRSMPWTETGSIGSVTGAKLVRQLRLHPKNVWAKELTISQHHVNDLESFRTWLSEVLDEHRRSENSAGRQ